MAFFTTKETGKGTGLGLSMAYGFITQSNGHIAIDSQVGRGTSFNLYLLRSEGAKEEATARENPPLTGGTERILIVEDDPQGACQRGAAAPKPGICRVAGAPDGTAAIASFEAASKPYDLLLTDVVMSGSLNGKDLADEVTQRWPTTKTIFMSGYAENAIMQEGRLDGGVLLLNKPFRKNELAQIVRQALDRASESAAAPPVVA